jgi:hypothetical protein
MKSKGTKDRIEHSISMQPDQKPTNAPTAARGPSHKQLAESPHYSDSVRHGLSESTCYNAGQPANNPKKSHTECR